MHSFLFKFSKRGGDIKFFKLLIKLDMFQTTLLCCDCEYIVRMGKARKDWNWHAVLVLA